MPARTLPAIIIRRLVIASVAILLGLLAILWGATPEYGDVPAQTSDGGTQTCAPGVPDNQCAAQQQ